MPTGVQIDQDFPRRVTRASLVFGVVFFWFLISLQLESQAYSYGLGAGLGIFSFEVFRMAVRVFLRTEQISKEQPVSSWKKWVAGGLLSMKLPIWGITIYAAVIDPSLSVLVFVGGIATPQLIMLLKVASRFLVSGLENGEDGEEGGSENNFSVRSNTGEVNATS